MSNRALKEFGNTNTGWSYSDLSDLATNHGGPEPLIEDIYSNGYEDGSGILTMWVIMTVFRTGKKK